MSANQEQRERLHEQASAFYLQGDYDEALATWRRLLEADPADPRAAEGVRLCESLDDGPPAPPARTAIDLGDDTERTLEQLDEALGGQGADWMDDATAGQGAGFELSGAELPPQVTVAPVRFDVSAPESMDIDAPGHAQTLDPASVRLDLDDLALPQDEGLVTDGAAQGAAAELERRAGELLAEAMQFYERGEREEALAVLNRLAILDDENDAARTFAAHIRAEIESSAEPPSHPAEPSAPAQVAAPRLPAAPLVPPGEIGMTDDLDLDLDAASASDDAAALTPSGRRTKAKLDVPAPRKLPLRWLLVAAGVLILGVAGYFLAQLGGDEASPSDSKNEAQPAESTQRAALGGPTAGGSRKSSSAEAEPASAPPAPATAAPAAGEGLDQLLERGRSAFEAGDYKAAVLAYDQALVLDSTNGEAKERLREAGDRYRSQKAAEETRSGAIASFNRGEYVEALRLFYRVTPADPEDEARIGRYLRNGWYNLGIGALRSGDCKTARDHFREAKQHDAEDAGIREGLSLAAKCTKSTLTTEEYGAVRALAPRGLDD